MEQENTKQHPVRMRKVPEEAHFGDPGVFRLAIDLFKARWHWAPIVSAIALVIAGLLHFSPSYSAKRLLNFEDSENNPLAASLSKATSGLLASKSGPFEKYSSFVKSREFFVSLANELRTKPAHRALLDRIHKPSKNNPWLKSIKKLIIEKPESVSEDLDIERLAGQLKGAISYRKAGPGLLEVKATTKNPQLSVDLSNTIAELTAVLIISDQLRSLNDSKKFLDSQLMGSQQRLVDLSGKFLAIKRHYDVASSEMIREKTTVMQRLSKDLQENEIKLEQNRNLIALLSSGDSSAGTSNADAGPSIAGQLWRKLESYRYKRTLLKAQGFQNDSWQIKEIDGEIQSLTEKLKATGVSEEAYASKEGADFGSLGLLDAINQLKKENQILVSRIESMQSPIGQLRRNSASLAKGAQELEELQKQAELEFGIYQTLSKRVLEFEAQIAILRGSIVPLTPSTVAGVGGRFAMLPRLMLGLVFGLLGTWALAWGFEQYQPGVRSRKDLLQAKLPILGSIPRMQYSLWTSLTQALGVMPRTLPDMAKLRERDAPEMAALEAVVRDLIATASAGKNGNAKVIAVFGDSSRTGTTELASNIAHELAHRGKRVLLMDCDYHKSILSLRLGFPKGRDKRAAALPEAAQAKRFCHRLNDHLDFIPAEGFIRSSVELVSGAKLKKLIYTFGAYYDYIVIDNSPLGMHPDPLVVASEADISILNTGYLISRASSLMSAARLLRKVTKGKALSVFNMTNLNTEFAEICLLNDASAEPRSDLKVAS